MQTATVDFPLLLGLLVSAIQNVFTSCCFPLCQCVIHHRAGVFKSPAFLSSYRYPPVCFLMCLLWKCLSEKPKFSKWHINSEFIALFTGCHPVEHLVWHSTQCWLYYLEEIHWEEKPLCLSYHFLIGNCSDCCIKGRIKMQLSSALSYQEIKLEFITKYNIYWSINGKTRGSFLSFIQSIFNVRSL